MPENKPPETRRIPAYKPPPAKPAIFRSKLLEDMLSSRRVCEVWAYLESPAKAEKIRDVVVASLPKVGFKHVESPVCFASISNSLPVVIFVDDRTICDINPEKIRENSPNARIVLLSERDTVCTMPRQHSIQAFPDVAKSDLVAAMTGSLGLDFGRTVHAFIRLAEDRMNIEVRDDKRAKRFVVLVVDDEPRWLAEFLPQLYAIVGRRAEIMTERTYEEAADFIASRGEDIICLISDMAFPKGGNVAPDAGRHLIGFSHERFPRIAKIIATKGAIPSDMADKALLMPKGSEGSIDKLRQFMLDYAGFGEFILPVRGVKTRIRSISELRQAVEQADIQTLEEFGKKDFFSTWLYMHGFHKAGDRIRPNRFEGEWLRGFIMGELEFEISELEKDPFVINDERGNPRQKTHSLREIADEIGRMPAELIEKWGEDDDFLSFWLMRHGYPGLADEVRPINGKGDEIRGRIMDAFARWIAHYEKAGIPAGEPAK